MIKFFSFGPAFGLPSPSPFCMKLEVWMKMAGIEYRTKVRKDPTQGPKGKLPFIKHGGVVVADSDIIIDYLSQSFEVELDRELTPHQRATGYAISKMLEDHLYWAMLYSRWVDPNNWKAMRTHFMGHMPLPVRRIMAGLVRLKVKKDLHSQGMGRHSAQDVYWAAKRDLRVVSTLLGDNRFLFGDEPCSYDAVVYGFIANVIDCELESPLKEFGRSHDNLVHYCQRMHERYYAATEVKSVDGQPQAA
ncbi:glutathione S-transferase family protein [Aestuariirhabdus litorea]|uniref:Glutathione S-transferase family protein n=1 Tax=Aestuariirhabdus litorea TaxID=2528527 RepID=A0A3P3VML2_9GAMM|nr:glutathione S-transferase family protein [Aestuariirhabdus litorea]RRJ83860.1 glutathione S-transferase family protein [Aestuariirhabdus litorea]RWW97083.1 glutathione S-transferase family protein [Endozoicomonadaceae bacterium GTF-13]